MMRKFLPILSILICLFVYQEVTAQKRSVAKKKAIPILIHCQDWACKAISLPKPEYPPAARYVNAAGKVTVEIVVDECGNVVSAQAISGHPLLVASAEKAARAAKFIPFQLGKKRKQFQTILIYNFNR